MNKIDSMDDQKPRIDRDDEGRPRTVWVSAMEGQGIDLLFAALTERLATQIVQYQLCIPPMNQGRVRSLFFQLNAIQAEEYDEQGNLLIDIRMQQVDWLRLVKRRQ